ncbi:hypothetical protein HTZ84_22405 [Haloterrigena sp. SYSU A558-1]|uniref:Uncharacterized protein n=1 Tax=Haloterrigena gelatinilytica TaxID=2741724 RepID=A0ABX2LHT8_9EURY|nr:hypothetical protein [Haloterrigena gelatinilytica]NUC75020.1 hypothetical protein [Haloterrigena gelatinilytica]
MKMHMAPSGTIIDGDDGRVHVEFTEEMSDGTTLTVTGWPEAAEDLDLLGPGPKEANGIEVVEEEPRYYDEEEQEHVAGYTKVVLAFDDEETLEWASDRLYDKATERFEWGMDDASDVQDFAGSIPHPTEVTA